MLGWLGVEDAKEGKATTLGAASGAVAGLVAITPCAGFVGGMAHIYIARLARVWCGSKLHRLSRRWRVLPRALAQEDRTVGRQPRRRRRPPRGRAGRFDPVGV